MHFALPRVSGDPLLSITALRNEDPDAPWSGVSTVILLSLCPHEQVPAVFSTLLAFKSF